jgi:polysaccharide export outer membrane protein
MILLLGGAAPADDPYILGSGDKLRITVFGNEDVSGDVEVDPSGQISLPLIQKVPASGKTVAQLQDDIFARLSPDYIKNPKITIEILTYRPFYIYGEVQRPGSYPYAAGLTVVNAVAVAGGFTYRADKDDIVISRGTGDARKTFRADRTDTVKPGDVLEVKERFF